MAKRGAQLDREIAAALRRPRSRISHATARSDMWDVAMDAILADDPASAARIVRDIGPDAAHDPPDRFWQALKKSPSDVRWNFEDHLGVRTAGRYVEAINDAIYRSLDPDALIAAVKAAKQHQKAMRRLAGPSGGGVDSSGAFDPTFYELSNLLIKAEEMVRRIKIQRRTGRSPKPSRRTAWKLRA
jgi:hypothetical protein